MAGSWVRGLVPLLVVLHLLAGAAADHLTRCRDTACPDPGNIAWSGAEHCCNVERVVPAREPVCPSHVPACRTALPHDDADHPIDDPCCSPCDLPGTAVVLAAPTVDLSALAPQSIVPVVTRVPAFRLRDPPPTWARPPPHLRWLRSVSLTC